MESSGIREQQKNKSSLIDNSRSLEWSDDEETADEIIKNDIIPVVTSTPHNTSQDYCHEKKLKRELSYYRPKQFDGHVKLKSSILSHQDASNATSNNNRSIPYVPAHAVRIVGEYVVNILWEEFLMLGSDALGYIKREDMSLVSSKLNELGYAITNMYFQPLDIEKDDYITFRETIELLANYQLSLHKNDFISPDILCCNCKSCTAQSKLTNKPSIHQSKSVLNIIYDKIKIKNSGKFRIKHLIRFLDEAQMKYDSSRLSDSYWNLRGDLTIDTFTDMTYYIDILRVHEDSSKLHKANEENHKAMATHNSVDNLYNLPDWLIAEFKTSEILLYKHHFSTIDVDRGGSIDVDELVQLTISLGNRITRDQAQDLINEYDVDGNGSIDFVEFMMLIFKIQRGTIELENNALAQSMVEARAQLHIFEEIEEFQRNPPPGAWILDYGELPIVMDVKILGPESTPYENGNFKLRVIFHEDYPYKPPDVKFLTRIFCINSITQIDGSGQIMHIKYIWDRNWTLNRLITHIIALLKQPDDSLLPEEMNLIVDNYISNKQLQLNLKEAAEAKACALSKLDASEKSTRKDHIDDKSVTKIAEPVKSLIPKIKSKKKYDEWSDDEDDDDDDFNTALFAEDKMMSNNNNLNSSPRDALVREDVKADSKSNIVDDESKQEETSVNNESKRVSLFSIASAHGGDAVKTEQNVESVMKSLSSLEQMHISTLILYRDDIKKFNEIARNYAEMFAGASKQLLKRTEEKREVHEEMESSIVKDEVMNDDYWQDDYDSFENNLKESIGDTDSNANIDMGAIRKALDAYQSYESEELYFEGAKNDYEFHDED